MAVARVGGGQIKPLVGGGCWWTWQSGARHNQRGPSASPTAKVLMRHRLRPPLTFFNQRDEGFAELIPKRRRQGEVHGGHVSRVTSLSSLPFSDSSPVAASRHFLFKKKKQKTGGFQGHKNQRNSSHYCPGVIPGSGGIRGRGDFCREIAHQGFRLPSSNPVAFSLIVNYLQSLKMQWKTATSVTASEGYKAHKLQQGSSPLFLFTWEGSKALIYRKHFVHDTESDAIFVERKKN